MKFSHRNRVLNHYKLWMDNTRGILIFFDAKGRITGFNKQAAKELGYGDELYYLPIYAIFKKVFLYKDKKLNIDSIYENATAEAIAYRKNQTCFPVELKITVMDRDRSYIGFCSAVDITEKKASAQEINELRNLLKNYQKVSNDVLDNITHELRTPVNGIVGFSNSLLDSELTSEQKEAVNIIKHCCDSMNSIISDFLDFICMKHNKLQLETKEFDFRTAIRQMLDKSKAKIFEKGLKLLVDISDDIPEAVIGDEKRLLQILNNLLSNSIKFTPDGQIGLQITKISENTDSVELFFMLSDTGIGISPEDKDKVFESFTRADASTTSSAGGIGLGLPLAKYLVEAMKGTISFDSEINQGSVFNFTIQLGLPHSVNAASSPSKEANPGIINYIDPEINAEDGEEISEIEYIRKKLKEVSSKAVGRSAVQEDGKDVIKDTASMLDKLAICIGMENWRTAEELASDIKKIISGETPEISNIALRLLFAIRNENREESQRLFTKLKMGMNKEA